MPTPAIRRLSPASVRRFGSGREYPAIPDLTAIQTDHYGTFQQADIDPEKRKQSYRKFFPLRALTSKSTWNISGTNWVSRVTHLMNVVSCV
jgi:hypothetical protein